MIGNDDFKVEYPSIVDIESGRWQRTGAWCPVPSPVKGLYCFYAYRLGLLFTLCYNTVRGQHVRRLGEMRKERQVLSVR